MLLYLLLVLGLQTQGTGSRRSNAILKGLRVLLVVMDVVSIRGGMMKLASTNLIENTHIEDLVRSETGSGTNKRQQSKEKCCWNRERRRTETWVVIRSSTVPRTRTAWYRHGEASPAPKKNAENASNIEHLVPIREFAPNGFSAIRLTRWRPGSDAHQRFRAGQLCIKSRTPLQRTIKRRPSAAGFSEDG